MDRSAILSYAPGGLAVDPTIAIQHNAVASLDSVQNLNGRDNALGIERFSWPCDRAKSKARALSIIRSRASG